MPTYENRKHMLFPKGKERVSTPPSSPEEREEIPGRNLQEYPKPGATISDAKRGIALIGNHQFNHLCIALIRNQHSEDTRSNGRDKRSDPNMSVGINAKLRQWKND